MRLNKFLAEAGVASRRAADKLIVDGKVKVNGKVVAELGVKINPESDKIQVNGRPISVQKEVVTYLLNKPRGVVTTAHDPEGRKTVMAFVPGSPRVFPCGRLDEETMGLVVLTSDGNLCYQLTHPKFEHEKEYVVHGRSKQPEKALERLRAGVELADGTAKADRISDVVINREKVKFAIIIHEGRNRLVRRLCAKVGIEIVSLTRVRVGKLRLDDLQPGKYRTVD